MQSFTKVQEFKESIKNDPNESSLKIIESIQNQAHDAQLKKSEKLISNKQDTLERYFSYLSQSIVQSQIEEHQTNESLKQKKIERFLQKIKSQQIHKIETKDFVINLSVPKILELNVVPFHIKIINQMKNFEVIEILCRLGPYSKRYTVLNQFSKSFRHSNCLLGLGTFGQVFSASYEDQHFAIKCLRFDLADTEFLRNCIQEFFVADMLSAIEVGPKLLRTKGFDFILFEDCMEFQMEICQPVRSETAEADLKGSLLKMHQLKVIHSDIKPANVMYSASYGKNVLLDFGVSEVVNEEVWEPTLSKFKGTYEYCGEEMKKLFAKKKQGMVNLYTNDSQMLERTIKDFQKKASEKSIEEKIKKTVKDQIFDKKLFQKNNIIQLKYLLYSCDRNAFFNEKSQDLIRRISKIQSLEAKQKVFEFCFYLNKFIQKEVLPKIALQNAQLDIKMIFEEKIQTNQAQQVQDKDLTQKRKKRQHNIANAQNSKKYLQMRNEKPSLKNLDFVLLNLNEIQSLPLQAYFQLIMIYVSFTKITYKVALDQKQNVSRFFSQNITSLIKDKPTQLGQLNYLHKRYFPQLGFVEQKCKNITFLFGFMLSYCMKDQFNEFKFQMLPLVLKECIFLNFKYHLFLEECLQKYYIELIKNYKESLITRTLIQTTQLIYMTDEHFEVLSEPLEPNKKYELRYRLRKIIQQTVKQFGFGPNLKPKYENKEETSLYIFYYIWILYNEAQCYRYFAQSFMKKLVKFIQEEFIGKQSLDEAQYFQKAFRYVSFQNYSNITIKQIPFQLQTILAQKQFPKLFPNSISELQKSKEEEVIEFIIKIKSFEKNITLAYNILEKFDSLYSAPQITVYFFINRRFQEAYMRGENFLITQLFDTLIKSESGIIKNYRIFSVFMSDWYEFFPLKNSDIYFKAFSRQRIKARNLIIIKILERIHEFEKNEKIKQDKQLQLDLDLFCLEPMERYSEEDKELRINLCGQIYFQMDEIIMKEESSIKKSLRYFEPFCQQQKSLGVGLLQKIYNPNQISFYQLLVKIKLLEFLPHGHLKYFTVRFDTYKLILQLIKKLIEQQQTPCIKINKLQQYIITHIMTQQAGQRQFQKKLTNTEQISQSESLQKYKIKAKIESEAPINLLQKLINRLQANIEPLEIDKLCKHQLFWVLFKVKRIFNSALKFTSSYDSLYSFHSLIDQRDQHESFEIIVEFIRQAIFIKEDMFEYNRFLKISCDILKYKEYFQGYQNSLKFIQFIQGEQKLQNNPAMRNVLFCVYLNILNINQILKRNFKLWKRILFKVYQLFPHFLQLPSKQYNFSQYNRVKIYLVQQIYFMTLKCLEPIKHQRKYKINLRQYIKKSFLMHESYSQQIYNYAKQFAFQFIKPNKRCRKNSLSLRSIELMKKKCKSIFINLFIEVIEKDTYVLGHPVNKDDLYQYLFEEKVLKELECYNSCKLNVQQKQFQQDFCKKHDIFDYGYFQYFFYRLPLNDLKQSLLKVENSDQQQIPKLFYKMKSTPQYQLIKSTHEIINQIFQLEINYYTKKLKKQTGLNYSQLGWIKYF